MVDDQNRCEWVNVSAGTGSLGQSRTKGHKTVVVVCCIFSTYSETELCGITGTGFPQDEQSSITQPTSSKH